MASEFTLYFSTPIGSLQLDFQENELCFLSIAENSSVNEQMLELKQESANKVKENTLSQLDSYFSSAISFLTIPLASKGTAFQRLVWHELTEIPLGETRTYGDIAKKLNSSPRAVGNACRKNPVQIIIPCHRVISATGIGGYAGETEGRQLNIKRWLLKHEGVAL